MSTIVGSSYPGLAPVTSVGTSRSIALPAVGLGVAGALVSFAWSWNPSYWGDEAATVLSAERPLASLWSELGRVDAVHGLYYFFMHFWIRLFGASELSTRLPSAIAIGIAVAGTVVLANLLLSRNVAIMSGVVFAVLPRVTYMGAEARSYATTAAVAAWLTILLVVLLRRRVTSRLAWIGYGLAVALSIYLFLYLVLLAGVHLLVMMSTSNNRALLRRWLLAAVVAVVAAAPILIYGLAQHNQIAFLAHRGYATAAAVFTTQWFGALWFAIPAWLLAAGGCYLLVRRYRATAVLLIGWFALPTAALLVGNAFIAPMYNLRYVSFCTPAVAIVVAAGISLLARNWMRVAVVAALVGLALPTYIAQRGPYAKDAAVTYPGEPGSDLRQAAQVVANNAHAGDAVVFDESVRPSRKPRLALRLYPQDFVGLKDVGLVTPYWQTAGLWDKAAPVRDSVIDGTHTVWALELPHASTPTDIVHLESLGYVVTQEILVNRITVYELTEET